MLMIIEQIGVVIIIIIIIFVLLITFIRSPKDKLDLLSSFMLLLAIIFINMFIYYPLINLLSFLFIILDFIYLISINLPYFQSKKDQDLFFEVKDEIWNDLKVNETVIEEN